LIILLAIPFAFSSCKDDAWSEGLPEYEHVYYFVFEDWGSQNNTVKFTVKQGETIGIPVQFFSERIRPYDVTAFYYVAGSAVLGTDYSIVDENGAVITPDAKGAYSMLWPNAKKGVKNIYVKALNGAKGTFLLQTFNPNETISFDYRLNNKTSDYTVNSSARNYKVTVTIQ
jgi:hypothetical protein